jgi:nitroimidazol reductase NimA-like FMN-containing flavoprotein (pyridoxamine 5'-phosphate oxidase superfamily)
MRGENDPAATARAIIEANLYMVLGTADEAGHPWVSPVYYAPVDYREFLWVSRPETLHSRNLVARPQVSIVIFDSSVPIGTGQGVYIAATAEEVTGDARVAAMEVFSRRSLGHGGREWTLDDVDPPAEIRLYRATASAHYILGSIDRLVAVDLQR